MALILVPGINGFVGKHLARELKSAGLSVIGVGRESTISPEIEDCVNSYHQCDLSDPKSVNILDLEAVDGVINLAGIAVVGDSFGAKQDYYRTNVESHTNLIKKLRSIGNNCRVIAVSSGAVYSSDQPLPLNENSRLITEEEGSPYAFSKVLLESALDEMIKAGEDIIIVRPFNHTGPGQGPKFIVPDIVGQAVSGDKIVVGPQNTRRDYTDVRDVARAYRLLITGPPFNEHFFNICSGVSTSRDELIELVLDELSKPSAQIETNPSLGRPNDPMELYGDHSRLTLVTSWQTEIPLKKTIHDFIATYEGVSK